jgi:hypothetical protein
MIALVRDRRIKYQLWRQMNGGSQVRRLRDTGLLYMAIMGVYKHQRCPEQLCGSPKYFSKIIHCLNRRTG